MQYATGVPDHRTSTGLNNMKMLFWAFLGSDIMFFGSLIATHMIYRGQSIEGPDESIFNIPVTTISTFILLMSSLSMVLALAGIQRNDLARFRFWTIMTATFGMIFIGFQMFEFAEFAHLGLTPRTNLFGSTLLVMTGFHGAHVAIGVLWLWSLYFASFKGKVRQDNALMVEIAGLYWHFVDIVWIVIFGIVYLVGAFGVEPAAHAGRATGLV